MRSRPDPYPDLKTGACPQTVYGGDEMQFPETSRHDPDGDRHLENLPQAMNV